MLWLWSLQVSIRVWREKPAAWPFPALAAPSTWVTVPASQPTLSWPHRETQFGLLFWWVFAAHIQQLCNGPDSFCPCKPVISVLAALICLFPSLYCLRGGVLLSPGPSSLGCGVCCSVSTGWKKKQWGSIVWIRSHASVWLLNISLLVNRIITLFCWELLLMILHHTFI